MIIALNNKCNLDKDKFHEYLDQLITINTEHKMILCPTTIHISSLCNIKQNTFQIGAQDVSYMGDGAHTGEISAEQLKSYGVNYCIVGHSERRKEQNETSEKINQKIKELLKRNIIPILCIGETLEERQDKKVQEVLEREITTAFKDLSTKDVEKIIIAYEPIWSIGTGLIPNNDQIDLTIAPIKRMFPATKILYGGSANEENIDVLKKCKEIDGFLLGGLSLKVNNLKIFLNKLN